MGLFRICLVAGLFVGFTPPSTAATLTSDVSKEGKVVVILTGEIAPVVVIEREPPLRIGGTAGIGGQRHHDVSILITGTVIFGRCFGSQPRAKTSMMIMRPPQHGHGLGSIRG
jgi:hypothetical protein